MQAHINSRIDTKFYKFYMHLSYEYGTIPIYKHKYCITMLVFVTSIANLEDVLHYAYMNIFSLLGYVISTVRELLLQERLRLIHSLII